jgi:LysR family positive regulator for ilvC
MDHRAFKHFLVLSDTLHFGKASQLISVSPSTLSRSIQSLEEELNCQLFLRDNRSVELTAEGIRFQQYARDSLQQWEQLQESLDHNKHHLHGVISLYCSVTASYSFLHEVLKKFRFDFPKIEIILHTGDTENAISRVLNDQEDMAIAARPMRMPASLAFEVLGKTPLVLIAPNNSEYLQIEADLFTKQYWQEVPMILPEKGIFRERADEWFNEEGLSPNIYAQIGGNEAIVSMVSLGFGIGLVPKIVVDNSPLADQVKVVPFQPDIDPVDVGFCVRKKRLQSPLIKALWNSIT